MHSHNTHTSNLTLLSIPKGGDTSLRITILDEKKTDCQVMQTLVLLIPH